MRFPPVFEMVILAKYFYVCLMQVAKQVSLCELFKENFETLMRRSAADQNCIIRSPAQWMVF